MFVFLQKTFKLVMSDIFLPVYSATDLVIYEYCIQVLWPYRVKGFNALRELQEEATMYTARSRHLLQA